MASKENRGTELIRAAEHGDLAGVRQRLADGVDPNARGPIGGWTALMRAATGDVVAALLAAGANITQTDDLGLDAMAHALESANGDVARALQQAGADVNARNRYGWTRLRQAAFMRNVPALELLRDLGADPGLDRGKLLSAAAWYSSEGHVQATEQAIDLLIALGEDVNAADDHGYTALHCAVSGDAHTPSDETWWNASSDGSDQTAARTLLRHGADPNRAGDDGFTPLLLAAASGLWADACIEALLAGRADPNKPNLAGTTPLMLAAGRARAANLVILLANGADSQQRDHYGQDALAYARRYLDGLLKEIDEVRAAPDEEQSLILEYLQPREAEARTCIASLEAHLQG